MIGVVLLRIDIWNFEYSSSNRAGISKSFRLYRHYVEWIYFSLIVISDEEEVKRVIDIRLNKQELDTEIFEDKPR